MILCVDDDHFNDDHVDDDGGGGDDNDVGDGREIYNDVLIAAAVFILLPVSYLLVTAQSDPHTPPSPCDP